MKSEILAYLREWQSAKRSDLLVHLTRKGYQVQDRLLRSIIEELIMVDGYCIASSENGYRLIRSEVQLEEAVNYLRKKSKPIAIRANQLINNYQKQNKTQLNITF